MIEIKNQNVAIAGTRSIKNLQLIIDKLDELRIAGNNNTIITGCANGADNAARNYAFVKNVKIQIHEADWEKYGRAAGPMRNKQMIKNASILICFWNLISPGTRNMITQATKKGIPILVVHVPAPIMKKDMNTF